MEICQRVRIPPSPTLEINTLAIHKKRQGERVFNLAGGDPDLPNHQAIVDAAHSAVQSRKSPYPAVAGIPELRELACQWMNDRHQANYRPSQTVVTCGGKFAIYAAVQALLDPGDRAMILAPYWVSYPGIIQLNSGVPVIVQTSMERGWKVDVEQITKHLKEVKLLILNNGCNPTGVLYSREELRGILQLCDKAGIVVLSDEVYSELVYGEAEFVSCSSFAEFQENVIVVQSCSKNFAMAGWRVGFAFGPETLIKALTIVQGQATTGTAIHSQRAALGALQNAAEVSGYVRQEMDSRRTELVQAYRQLFNPSFESPASAIYLFAPLSDFTANTSDSTLFCKRALELANVALVPGIAFGYEGYVRLAFSGSIEQSIGGLQALAAIRSQL